MRIDIRGDELRLAEATRELIDQKTRLALGRVAAAASDVRIVVRDLNGPKKGLDRACVVGIRLRRGGEVHAEATAEGVLEAVDRALECASRSARRILTRRLELGRETIRLDPGVR